MSKSLLIKVASVGGACAAIGAGAGILGTSAAATGSSSSPSTAKHHVRHGRALLGRAVHADAVIGIVSFFQKQEPEFRGR